MSASIAAAREIREQFPGEQVAKFLAELTEDVLDNRIGESEPGQDLRQLYGVNVVLTGDDEESCSIVVETAPTLQNLLGTIDRVVGPEGRISSSHMLIRAGALLRAGNGFLIIEARDVLSEPGSWKILIRTLK